MNDFEDMNKIAKVPEDDFTVIEHQIIEELHRLESHAYNLATSLKAVQGARAAQHEHQARVMHAVGLFFDGKISQSRLYEEYITL